MSHVAFFRSRKITLRDFPLSYKFLLLEKLRRWRSHRENRWRLWNSCWSVGWLLGRPFVPLHRRCQLFCTFVPYCQVNSLPLYFGDDDDTLTKSGKIADEEDQFRLQSLIHYCPFTLSLPHNLNISLTNGGVGEVTSPTANSQLSQEDSLSLVLHGRQNPVHTPGFLHSTHPVNFLRHHKTTTTSSLHTTNKQTNSPYRHHHHNHHPPQDLYKYIHPSQADWMLFYAQFYRKYLSEQMNPGIKKVLNDVGDKSWKIMGSPTIEEKRRAYAAWWWWMLARI